MSLGRNCNLDKMMTQAHQRGYRLQITEKSTPIIPLYSFINQLITCLKSYSSNIHHLQGEYLWWSEYIFEHFRGEKTFISLIRSWKKHKESSLECHLLQSLLYVENHHKIKLFLKARRLILTTAAKKVSPMLDEILFKIEDCIALVYKLFQGTDVRKTVTVGIKNIFLSFKVTEAKIYSSVFLEYLMQIEDDIYHIENDEATVGQQIFKASSDHLAHPQQQSLFSSISNFQSSIHEDNGLYQKVHFNQRAQRKFHILEHKFANLRPSATKRRSPEKNDYQHHNHHTDQKNFLNPNYEAINHRSMNSKEKSSFYEFISQNNGQKECQCRAKNQSKSQNKKDSYDKRSRDSKERQIRKSVKQSDLYPDSAGAIKYKQWGQSHQFDSELKMDPIKISENQPQLKKSHKEQVSHAAENEIQNKFFFSSMLSKDSAGDNNRSSFKRLENSHLQPSFSNSHLEADHRANFIICGSVETNSEQNESSDKVSKREFESMIDSNRAFKQQMLQNHRQKFNFDSNLDHSHENRIFSEQNFSDYYQSNLKVSAKDSHFKEQLSHQRQDSKDADDDMESIDPHNTIPRVFDSIAQRSFNKNFMLNVNAQKDDIQIQKINL